MPPSTSLPRELLRPIVGAWTEKFEGAKRARASWTNMATQCRMFYQNSARAMHDVSLQQRFWKMNVPVPKFRMAVNLAYEYIAIQLPELLWSMPHRDCTPKIAGDELGPEVFGGEESPLWQMRQQELQQIQMRTAGVVGFMGDWLNYTPREMPGGGLEAHSELATIDALLVGRGLQFVRPYSMPGTDKRLTGCFWEPPERLLVDPDYPTLAQAKWIALFHYDPITDVEDRFKQPRGSLSGKGTIESSWSRSEVGSSPFPVQSIRDGGAKNMIGWWEVWSKAGIGCRFTGMDDGVKSLLEETLGDYVYLAVAPGVPHPLNCTSDELNGIGGQPGLSIDEVKARFAWPIPLWQDNRWPCEVLDFYHNTDCSDPSASWPVPPLAPAMGEMQALNYLWPWALNAAHERSFSRWVVPTGFVKKVQEALAQGDGGFIEMPPTVNGDIRQVVTKLEQDVLSGDVWKMIEGVTHMWRYRMGMVDSRYGENSTQSRVAQEAESRQAAIGIRTEHMRGKVVRYQAQLATTEAIATHLFIRPEDVVNRYGQSGAMAWQLQISSQDVETVVRQVDYTISASSIRRPNRERDIANLQEVMQYWQAVMASYADGSGDFEPFNGMLLLWAKLHDMDVSQLLIPPPNPPDPEQQRLQQEAVMLENEKVKAEIGKLGSDAQAKMIDAQLKAGQAGTDQQNAELEMQAKAFEQQMKLIFDSQSHQQELEQDAQSHILDLVQDRQSFTQSLAQQKAMGQLKLALARKAAAAKPKPNGKPKPQGSRP